MDTDILDERNYEATNSTIFFDDCRCFGPYETSEFRRVVVMFVDMI